MYPMIPCGNCGAPIQYVPELAGHGVYCPTCGQLALMPGGEPQATQYETSPAQYEPEAYQEPQAVTAHRTHYAKPKRRGPSIASLIPAVAMGAGVAMILFFGFIHNSAWMTVHLRDENDTVAEAMWRRFHEGAGTMDTTGLTIGAVMLCVGVLSFMAGKRAK